MNLLLDTHLLIWAATRSRRLSTEAISVISEPGNTLYFSVASLWETAIKSALRRQDFAIDVATLRAGLLANGYIELPIEGRHILTLRDLVAIHRDPFDRLLVAQAKSEGLLLLTVDRQLAAYGDSVRIV